MDDSPSSLSIIQPSSAVRLDDDHPTPAAAAVLAKWEALQQAVEQATTIDDLKQIRDALSLLWVVAKKAKLGLKMQNDIAETKLRDERKAGELLRAMKENGERAKSGRPLLSHDMTIAPTLPDLGITGDFGEHGVEHGTCRLPALLESLQHVRQQLRVCAPEFQNLRRFAQHVIREPSPRFGQTLNGVHDGASGDGCPILRRDLAQRDFHVMRFRLARFAPWRGLIAFDESALRVPIWHDGLRIDGVKTVLRYGF